MNDKTKNVIFIISAIGILSSTLLFLTKWFLAPYIFAVAAAGIAIVRLSSRYSGSDFRLKRLHRIETVSALLFVGASYMMFKNMNEWILFVLIGALLQLYVSFILNTVDKNKTK